MSATAAIGAAASSPRTTAAGRSRTQTRSEARDRRSAIRPSRSTAAPNFMLGTSRSICARHADVEVLTTCAATTSPGATSCRRASTRQRHPGAAFSGQARARPARVRPPLRARVSTTALDRRRARMAGRRRTESPGLIGYLSKHASDYDYCIVFSYRYLPRVSRRARGAVARRSWCRQPNAIRRSDCRCSARSSAAFAP